MSNARPPARPRGPDALRRRAGAGGEGRAVRLARDQDAANPGRAARAPAHLPRRASRGVSPSPRGGAQAVTGRSSWSRAWKTCRSWSWCMTGCCTRARPASALPGLGAPLDRERMAAAGAVHLAAPSAGLRRPAAGRPVHSARPAGPRARLTAGAARGAQGHCGRQPHAHGGAPRGAVRPADPRHPHCQPVRHRAARAQLLPSRTPAPCGAPAPVQCPCARVAPALCAWRPCGLDSKGAPGGRGRRRAV